MVDHSDHHEPPRNALDLIRACLATGEHPRLDAWAALGDTSAVLRTPIVKRAGLMPQLLYAADLAGVELEGSFRSACRAATTHEELRIAVFAPACRDALTEAATEAIVLRGVAFGHSVYDRPALRHCHDFDMLVPDGPGSVAHPTGFPISRHVSLFDPAVAQVSWADVVSHSTTTEIAGVQARVLDPVDALVHVCVHAATIGQPHNPLWCVDAGLLIKRFTALDWERVVERASEWKKPAETYYALAFLREKLDVPVPEKALAAVAPRLPRARRRARTERRRAAAIAWQARVDPRLRLLRRPARVGLRMLRSFAR